MKKNCLDCLPNSLGDRGYTLKICDLQLLEDANKILMLYLLMIVLSHFKLVQLRIIFKFLFN